MTKQTIIKSIFYLFAVLLLIGGCKSHDITEKNLSLSTIEEQIERYGADKGLLVDVKTAESITLMTKVAPLTVRWLL